MYWCVCDMHHLSLFLLIYRCNLTITPAVVNAREQVLKALPGHDAVFLVDKTKIDSEFLDVAGKFKFYFLFNLLMQHF